MRKIKWRLSRYFVIQHSKFDIRYSAFQIGKSEEQ
jgi:hypothetical protein